MYSVQYQYQYSMLDTKLLLQAVLHALYMLLLEHNISS